MSRKAVTLALLGCLALAGTSTHADPEGSALATRTGSRTSQKSIATTAPMAPR